ncbi:MAG TPA: SseB family protein [Phycicoccus sp.]|nr:SseB family protein [Phycicoccus sp.]
MTAAGHPANPRDHDHHPSHVPGSEATDSAGVTWGGRDLSPSGFEADTGAADPTLLTVLAETADDRTLMRQVAAARFLIPIVAEPTELDHTGPLVVDASVDLAAVTLVGPDGQRALPVFSGIEALAAWDTQARPVPVDAARIGQAAISEQCDVIVIDVAGPSTRVLRPSMVWALAMGQDWQPAHEDPVVARAVDAATAAEGDLTAYTLEDGQPHGQGILGVVLTLRPGLAADAVQMIATRVGERLATDGEVRARIDGLAFRLT